MLIAGEPSGDLLAAELVHALRTRLISAGAPEPAFLGAGGPKMAGAGVQLATDLTQFAIIGLSDVLRNLWRLRRILRDMLDLACAERPDAIICVDYGGFNRRFAAALRARQPADWHPKLIQYVSPQVWASRPSRAKTLARDLDLLICILPIEKAWYAARYPNLRVDFVGHPILDRHPAAHANLDEPTTSSTPDAKPRVLLLPGSRSSEIAHHWPVMAAAARLVQASHPAHWTAVFTSEHLRRRALELDDAQGIGLETRMGCLDQELSRATLAIAATGTVTLECALWRVPTIAIYKASWSTYQIARRIIRVRHLAMPNLLADATVMPELLQNAASPSNLAATATRLLSDPAERACIRSALANVVRLLGQPGAAQRAATSILSLLPSTP